MFVVSVEGSSNSASVDAHKCIVEPSLCDNSGNDGASPTKAPASVCRSGGMASDGVNVTVPSFKELTMTYCGNNEYDRALKKNGFGTTRSASKRGMPVAIIRTSQI